METKILSDYSDSSIAFHHAVSENPIDYKFNLHSHTVCEITFILSGDVSWVIEGKTYKIKKNDLVILRPEVVHGVRLHSAQVYDRYNIEFNDKLIADRALDDIPREIEVLNFSANTYVTDLFKKLDFYSKHFCGERARILISGIIEELVFNLTLQTKESTVVDSSLLSPMLNRALEYIDANYTACIGVEDLCRELYVSKSHIHSLFATHLRTSPKKYINIKRLAYAQRLIKMGKKPYAIYADCGFSDYASFYRNYKKHFGYAPSCEEETDLKIEIMT